MKKIFFLSIAVILLSGSVRSQEPFSGLYYNRSLPQGIQIRSMVNFAPDSSYMVAGSADIQGLVMKLSNSGEIHFSRKFDFTVAQNHFDKIITTKDNNFLISGVVDTVDFLIKINPSGDTLWTSAVASSGTLTTIIETNDSGFVLLQEVPNNDPSLSKILITKFTSTGTPLWSDKISTGNIVTMGSIAEGTDGTFVLCGYFEENTHEVPFLIRISSAGEKLWSKKVVVSSNGYGFGLDILPSGQDFLVWISVLDIGNSYTSIIKIDTSCSVIWAHKYYSLYKTSQQANRQCMARLRNGDYCFGGSRIFRINSDGTLLWNGSPFIMDNGVCPANDDGVMIFGNGPFYLTDEESLGPQIGIIKADIDGYSTSCFELSPDEEDTVYTPTFQTLISSVTSLSLPVSQIHPVITGIVDSLLNRCIQVIGAIAEEENEIKLLIFPNPVMTTAVISLESIQTNCDFKAELYDISGRIIWQENFYSQQIAFNRTGIPAGTYLMKISDGSGRTLCSRKIILN